MMPASAMEPSAAGPMEAPVNRLTLNFSFLPRSASAIGNSLGSPNRVKPLMPSVTPSSIQDAASSADTILSRKAGLRINLLKSCVMLSPRECIQIMSVPDTHKADSHCSPGVKNPRCGPSQIHPILCARQFLTAIQRSTDPSLYDCPVTVVPSSPARRQHEPATTSARI